MKTIIEMAREVGMIDSYDPSEKYISVLERFAELVRADEREACAKVCESLFDITDDSCDEAEKCAAAIRARGNT